jgi:hypothetical protein
VQISKCKFPKGRNTFCTLQFEICNLQFFLFPETLEPSAQSIGVACG